MKSPVASLCLACSSVRNRVKVTIWMRVSFEVLCDILRLDIHLC